MTAMTEDTEPLRPHRPLTARQRVRAEMTQDITDVARRHLAESGPAGLSLRAVARDVGVVSSAVYRYFPSRDDLLTALIVEAYDDLGAAAEAAERKVRRSDLAGRWLATCRGVRDWALAHPHEYALVFGTPVPGYVAPLDTVAAATRVPALLIALLVELHEQGGDPGLGDDAMAVPRRARGSYASARAFMGRQLSDDLVARGLTAWTWLFGAVSFELFGHTVGSVDDADAYFGLQVSRMGRLIGL